MGFGNATEEQQKLLAFAPKVSGFISFVLSSCVLVSFYRKPTKRKRLYHRLVFVMSCYGILMSVGVMIGTFVFPSDTPNVYGAKGTIATCYALGVVAQLVLAVHLYYSSLSVYCFVAIKANFEEEKIAWIEPWIHGLIHLFTVTSSIIIATTDNINPGGPVCWIGTAPEHCGSDTGIPCERGDPKKARLLFTALVIVPVYMTILISVIMMIGVYRTQKHEDLTKYQGKKIIIEKFRRRKTRIIVIQGSLYLAAYVAAYSVAIVHRTISLKHPPNYTLWIISVVLASSQSFFFTLVYFGLQIKNDPSSPETNHRGESYVFSLQRRISLKEKLCGIKNCEQNIEGQMNKEDKSFSIFDGTQVSSSPWSAFLIEFDDDDDDDGNKEVKTFEDIETNRDFTMLSLDFTIHSEYQPKAEKTEIHGKEAISSSSASAR